MRSIYTTLFSICIPYLIARMFWRSRRDSEHRIGWCERLGIDLPSAPSSKPIWIHAVSVGETVAATPIVQYLQSSAPDIPILFTTTTVTGAATARQRFGDGVVYAYFPYDLPWVLKRYLAHFKPRLLVLMETELWPNLLSLLHQENVPVLLANARLSEKSARRYRYVPVTTAKMLQAITAFGAQSADDAARFISLGAPVNAVATTGSIKFDVQLPPSVHETGQVLRRKIGTDRAVLIAASTRQGEEELVLEAFLRARATHAKLLLALAPRHPRRFDLVAALVRKKGLVCVRHAAGEPCDGEVDVYLIDSIGELPSFFVASDIAFVGGSLLPFGGHNVLEPAALGVPVLVGPFTYNFTEIVTLLDSVGALRVAADVDELVERICQWITSGDERDRAGTAGKKVVAANKGAAAKIASMLDLMLAGVGDDSAPERPAKSGDI